MQSCIGLCLGCQFLLLLIFESERIEDIEVWLLLKSQPVACWLIGFIISSTLCSALLDYFIDIVWLLLISGLQFMDEYVHQPDHYLVSILGKSVHPCPLRYVEIPQQSMEISIGFDQKVHHVDLKRIGSHKPSLNVEGFLGLHLPHLVDYFLEVDLVLQIELVLLL